MNPVYFVAFQICFPGPLEFRISGNLILKRLFRRDAESPSRTGFACETRALPNPRDLRAKTKMPDVDCGRHPALVDVQQSNKD